MSSTKRDARELEFFERSPWDNIPKEKVGIGGLKKRLDALILRVSRRCFDDIGIEMGGLLSTARSDLEQLGVARETPVEQRLYLTQIASSFSALSCKAIDAHYAREACFRDTAMRLATLISTCNDKFSDMMFSEGATHLFGKSNKSEKDREQIHPSSEEESDDPGEGNSSTSASPKDAPSSKHNVHYPELASICRNLTDIPKTRRIGLMSIIARDFRDCRGMDIVSMDSAILPSLFTEQTKYWRSFALRYIISVIEHIHDFIHRMLRVVSRGAEELIGRLWSKLKVEIIGGYKSAITHVEFLVKVETTGKLMTLNHYYADNIRKAQRERMRQRLARVPSWAPGDEAPLVRVDDTINVYTSNEDHAIEIIHDSLKSYYKVARKRFVDAVINQAMGHFLLSSPVSPLWRFSPEFVSTLKDEELKDLITEPAVKQEKRKTLRAEISRLERGLSVLGQD